MMKNNLTKLFLVGVLTILQTNSFCEDKSKESSNSNSNLDHSSQFLSNVKDTVYTLKPSFLEVNIASQKGFLHFKDSVFTFNVSTGTKNVEDGVETNEGLYTIHSMKNKWYSIQFDSTLLLNWMGFNYGIGFHALSTSGYYKYLGKKRSSHGCVRVSKEDAIIIYKHITVGTPVLIHKGNNVLTVAFGDSIQYMKNYSYSNLRKILPERLNKIYSGHYYIADVFKQPKIFIDDDNVTHDGLPIGNSKKIAKRQLLSPISLFVSSAIPQFKDCMLIENFNFPKTDLSMVDY